MGDLGDLLRSALDRSDENDEAMNEMKKIHENTFGRVRTKFVYNASIEWTMHEVFSYAMSVIGRKEEDREAAKKAARLVAELRDTLIETNTYDSTKMPNINYFHSLNAVKEPE